MQEEKEAPPGDAISETAPSEPLAEAQATAAKAVARYRELVAAQPGLVPELVRGSTTEEIDASVEVARRAYSEVSRRIAEMHEREVPAGNPARSASLAAIDTLSPESKIALGLRGK